MESVG